ncbi:MAG: ATP-binding cassette domain-containing protein, partial [[Eubacterium] sulci]|nr:ATP-binding cassette domain-containing protein [[Eubacterium] sulci]
MENIYFRTSDLTVGYNKKPLIKDINIDVDFGEIVTMIGPNGAGKSTILKSITKHLEMVGGEAFIADASLVNLSFKALAQQMSVVLTEKIKGEL